jgi:hypothetical protein
LPAAENVGELKREERAAEASRRHRRGRTAGHQAGSHALQEALGTRKAEKDSRRRKRQSRRCGRQSVPAAAVVAEAAEAAKEAGSEEKAAVHGRAELEGRTKRDAEKLEKGYRRIGWDGMVSTSSRAEGYGKGRTIASA